MKVTATWTETKTQQVQVDGLSAANKLIEAILDSVGIGKCSAYLKDGKIVYDGEHYSYYSWRTYTSVVVLVNEPTEEQIRLLKLCQDMWVEARKVRDKL